MSTKLQVETARLIIRPYRREDYKEWARSYNERLPNQHRHDAGFDGSHYSKKWFQNEIEAYHLEAEGDETYVLGVFRKEDDAHIGEVELIPILRTDYHWAMMGYMVHNQFQRQGYGKEAIVAAVEMFFKELKIHRIELQIDVDNKPSLQFAESLGFQFECKREDFYFDEGRWMDQLIYVKTKKKAGITR